MPVPPNQQNISLHLDVKINSGQPVIGVLDALSDTWHKRIELQEGAHDYPLELGELSSIRLIFYSADGAPLDFSVDFGALMEAPDSFVIEPAANLPAPAAPVQEPGPPKAGKKPKYYYCQKPWTDMSNLTVDGRMDVCCIATGASQQEFALGNFFSDDFQSMWNGQAMRRFRRTVNSGSQLAPCRRCPMSYNYGGVFFHARNTAYSLLYPFMRIIPGHKWRDFLQATVLPRLLKVIKPLFFGKFKADEQ
jgi:radical SAM protein with 4Fe4S-binding SPASM domain